MSDLNLLELGRSFIRNFYSGPPTGVTQCTSQGELAPCLPQADTPYADVDGPVNQGDPVPFVLPNALTCYTETVGLEIAFSLDSITNRQMTLNDDGTHSITIEAFDWQGPAIFTVRDLNEGTEITLELAELPEVIPQDDDPVDPLTECDDDPNPVIAEDAVLEVYPDTSIEVGQTVTVSFPLASVEECDETQDNLSAYVRVNDGDPVNAELFDSHFIFEQPYNSFGEYNIIMYIRDDSRPEAESVVAGEVTISVAEEVCTELIPPESEPILSPDITETTQGADTEFTIIQNDLIDCFDADLNLLDGDNRYDLLFDPVVSYAGGTLEITGQILPSVTSGTLSFNFEDNYGIPMTLNIPLPTIVPIEVTNETSPIEEGIEAVFSIPEVPGALNYYFRVTLPSEIDDLESNQLEPAYYYTPSEIGDHTLRVEVRAYNDELITIEHPFTVDELTVEITPDDLTFEVDVESIFTATTVPDALNYRFWVTLPSEIDTPESNQLDPAYAYTPSEVGEHILNLEITTDTYDTIMVQFPFVVE